MRNVSVDRKITIEKLHGRNQPIIIEKKKLNIGLYENFKHFLNTSPG